MDQFIWPEKSLFYCMEMQLSPERTMAGQTQACMVQISSITNKSKMIRESNVRPPPPWLLKEAGKKSNYSSQKYLHKNNKNTKGTSIPNSTKKVIKKKH
jgi:hypothetical protein